MNPLLRGLQVGLITGVIASGALMLLRPARLRSAGVTSVTSANPAMARVALSFSVGLPPSSVIIDIFASDHRLGSATVSGGPLTVEVPLEHAAERCRVSVTTTYRVLGRLLTVVKEFGEG